MPGQVAKRLFRRLCRATHAMPRLPRASLLLFLIVFIACASAATIPSHSAGAEDHGKGTSRQSPATVRIRSETYIVEVARTPRELSIGLMGRPYLPSQRGMIFIFDRPDQQKFWMKNTLIPLDIVFVSEQKRIDSFHTMVPCTADPCPVYPSKGRVKYAIEINAGEIVKHGFAVGDAVSISFDGQKTK